MPPSSHAGPSYSQSARAGKGKRRQRSSSPPEESSASPIKRAKAAERDDAPPRFVLPDDIEIESEATVLRGESEDVEAAGWSDRDRDRSERTKPVRLLDNFVILDSRHNNQLISLEELDRDGSAARIEAFGDASPYFVGAEEDGGDDDDDDDEIEDEEDAPVPLFTTELVDVWVDHCEFDGPIWIETQCAWYILCRPRLEYKKHYDAFETNHKVVQTLLSLAALEEHEQRSEEEEAALLNMFLDVLDDVLCRKCAHQDITNAMPALADAVETIGESLRGYALVRKVIHAYDTNRVFPSSESPTPHHTPVARTPKRHRTHHRPQLYEEIRNIDERAIRTQNAIHVTSFIRSLARRYFDQKLQLHVVDGPLRVPKVEPDASPAPPNHERRLLRSYVDNARLDPVMLPIERAVDKSGNAVLKLGHKARQKTYRIGDVALFLPGEFNGKKGKPLPEQIPDDARLEHIFWFGLLIDFDFSAKVCHVVWLEHSSRTIFGHIGNPRELFAFPACGEELMSSICGSVNVRILQADEDLSDDITEPYFCRLLYEKTSASFIKLPLAFGRSDMPFCWHCQSLAQREDNGKIKDDELTLRGQKLHVGDMIVFTDLSNESGCASIGQVLELNGKSRRKVRVTLYGRLASLRGILPEGFIPREQDLFRTRCTQDISVRDIVRQVHIIHPADFTHLFKCDEQDGIRDWLLWSKDHFIASYISRDLEPSAWSMINELDHSPHWHCKHSCTAKRFRTFMDFQVHVACREQPLRCLDLFAGTLALSHGIETGARSSSSEGAAGLMQTTHAVEIAPSAAQSIRKNFPRVKVLNECVNIALKYAWENFEGHAERRSTVLGVEEWLPKPPARGEVDVITAGFPCQAYSPLNRFKRAGDGKATLFLNLLAWIDTYRPSYVIAENVAGFLRFNLDSPLSELQEMDKTGLLSFVHCLVQMGYQVRFSLLNAVHYGAPQRRIRFILFAAKRTKQLMIPPIPSHYHARSEGGLGIKFIDAENNPLVVHAVDAKKGCALHPFISIEDAISDLPRWDLQPHSLTSEVNISKSRKQDDPDLLALRMQCPEEFASVYSSQETSNTIGPESADYTSPPKNVFQQHVRSGGLKNLQHCMRKERDDVVELLSIIPLRAGADYTALFNIAPSLLPSWLRDPSSSNGHKGYKARAIRRADKDDVFQTAVTNFGPFAKQSKVLHPWCRRTFTPCELSRSQAFPDSYEFVVDERSTDPIKAIHRLIGNAVPWPLAEAIGRSLREAEFQHWIDEGMAI